MRDELAMRVGDVQKKIIVRFARDEMEKRYWVLDGRRKQKM